MEKLFGLITLLLSLGLVLVSCQQPLVTGNFIDVPDTNPSPSISTSPSSTPGLNIISISPIIGPIAGNTTVTLSVTGYSGLISVYIQGVQCTTSANLPVTTGVNTFTCLTGAALNPGLSTVLVINNDLTGHSLTNAFTYCDNALVICPP